MNIKHDTRSIVREINRRTRQQYNAEEKIRIVLEGLKGKVNISEISHREVYTS